MNQAEDVSPDPLPWHYGESGTGRPLVLLHGIGMSHAAWNAVTPYLCRTRRVVAFDIAGFGLTPPLRTRPATMAHLVDGLEQSLRAIGIDAPVDMAGNSLGGSMALEAARRGLARSVVAISPPGLWLTHPPRHVKYVFGSLRFMATHLPKMSTAMMRTPWTRELVLAVPISAGSRRMPAADAIRAVVDLAASTAFEDTFHHTRAPLAKSDVAVPVTVAFGDRDWILTKGSRRRDTLSAGTRWITRRRWGHVPMWIDPQGVAELILAGGDGPFRAP